MNQQNLLTLGMGGLSPKVGFGINFTALLLKLLVHFDVCNFGGISNQATRQLVASFFRKKTFHSILDD